jgi:SAM-dependent methyltransferase
MYNNSTTFTRLEISTPELDAAELDWWKKFSEIEEHFCWVQTPAIQQFLRGDYLRHIVGLVPPNGRILELGCGTGWLVIILAKLKANRVVGVDFSDKQIEQARRRAVEAKVTDRVSFRVADVFSMRGSSEVFDVIIVHGLLHHLTMIEIRRALATAHTLLCKNGRMVIWEPVHYPLLELPPKAQRLLRFLRWLQNIPVRGQRWKLRRFSAEERRVRELIAEREVVTPPFGPSPKEMPFSPGELPTLIAPYFHIKERRRCLAVSHLIAQETLLMEVSHPFLARLVRWPLLIAARQIERRLLALDPPPSGMWIVEMFDCVPIHSTHNPD